MSGSQFFFQEKKKSKSNLKGKFVIHGLTFQKFAATHRTDLHGKGKQF